MYVASFIAVSGKDCCKFSMAKVAAPPGSLPSDSLPYCGTSMNGRPVSKRKTPSELRVRFSIPNLCFPLTISIVVLVIFAKYEP